MSYIKTISLVILSSTLVGCSFFKQDYIPEKKQTAITATSSNVQQKEQKDNTQAPIEETTTATTSPIEPPKTYEAEPSHQSVIVMTPPSKSAPQSVHIDRLQGLTLNIAYQQAWNETAKALSQSGYPVMEQDNTSGTYYILDKISTGGVIKRDTPIYQLHLQKAADNKTIATLNNAQNQPADDVVVQRILGTLKNKMNS